jgi:hypothetical protein
MSDEAEYEPRAHSGLEARSVERLRSLIGSFSKSRLRPIYRIAARRLLTGEESDLRSETFALELPRRTVWLDHRRTFNPTGPGSGAIDLFCIRSRPRAGAIVKLVRKVVHRPDFIEERLGWLGEALFYLDIAPRISTQGLVIPELYGCSLDGDSIILVLEYLDPDRAQHPDLARIALSARLIGSLGAITHQGRHYEAEWIRPFSPRFPVETLAALESLAAHSIPDADEQSRIVGAFERLIGSPEAIACIRANGYRSLAHGDLHTRNLFAVAGEQNGMAVIDWGKVCEGLIGHDAILLLLPRFIKSEELGSLGFSAAVDLVQQNLISGALSVDPSLDPARVRLGLEIGLVFHTALLAARNSSDWLQLGQEQQQRVASMLRGVAAIAQELLNKYGS